MVLNCWHNRELLGKESSVLPLGSWRDELWHREIVSAGVEGSPEMGVLRIVVRHSRILLS